MAGVEGFEPSQAVLETDVLPLTLYPYKTYSTIIHNIQKECNTKWKNFSTFMFKIKII